MVGELLCFYVETLHAHAAYIFPIKLLQDSPILRLNNSTKPTQTLIRIFRRCALAELANPPNNSFKNPRLPSISTKTQYRKTFKYFLIKANLIQLGSCLKHWSLPMDSMKVNRDPFMKMNKSSTHCESELWQDSNL